MMGKRFTVELVYDHDCPNLDRARATIRAALREVGAEPAWQEWDRASAETPNDLRRFGSPTVLVNGRDVGCDDNAMAQAEATACRVYRDANGRVCGAPSSRSIVDAINAAHGEE